MRHRAGFTLVELMVVVAIMGVGAGAVVLSLPDPVPHIVKEAENLAARLSLAREEALLTNRPVALRIVEAGYRFEAFDGENWEALDGPLKPRNWPDDVSVDAPSRLMFDATGLSDAGEIKLTRKGQTTLLTIDGAGEVHLVQ